MITNPFTGRTLNERSDEARRKSAEKRKSHSGTGSKLGAVAGGVVSVRSQAKAAKNFNRAGVEAIRRGIIPGPIAPKYKFGKGKLAVALGLGALGGAAIGRMIKKKEKKS